MGRKETTENVNGGKEGEEDWGGRWVIAGKKVVRKDGVWKLGRERQGRRGKRRWTEGRRDEVVYSF